jgi:hypothetical protein
MRTPVAAGMMAPPKKSVVAMQPTARGKPKEERPTNVQPTAAEAATKPKLEQHLRVCAIPSAPLSAGRRGGVGIVRQRGLGRHAARSNRGHVQPPERSMNQPPNATPSSGAVIAVTPNTGTTVVLAAPMISTRNCVTLRQWRSDESTAAEQRVRGVAPPPISGSVSPELDASDHKEEAREAQH